MKSETDKSIIHRRKSYFTTTGKHLLVWPIVVWWPLHIRCHWHILYHQ